MEKPRVKFIVALLLFSLSAVGQAVLAASSAAIRAEATVVPPVGAAVDPTDNLLQVNYPERSSVTVSILRKHKSQSAGSFEWKITEDDHSLYFTRYHFPAESPSCNPGDTLIVSVITIDS